MQFKVILIVAVALGVVRKRFEEMEIRGKVETIPATSLL